MPRRKAPRHNHLRFDGITANDVPHTGNIVCLLGEGIKLAMTGEVMAVVLYIGEIKNGEPYGAGRFHIVHADRRKKNNDRVWMGDVPAIFTGENPRLSNMASHEAQYYYNYIRANKSYICLDLGEHWKLGDTINRLASQTDDALTTEHLRNYAHSIVSWQFRRTQTQQRRQTVASVSPLVADFSQHQEPAAESKRARPNFV